MTMKRHSSRHLNADEQATQTPPRLVRIRTGKRVKAAVFAALFALLSSTYLLAAPTDHAAIAHAQARAAAVVDLDITGPAHGFVGEKYLFTALLEPKGAADDATIVWSPEPFRGQGTVQATYQWHTAGKQAVKVTVVDQDGNRFEAGTDVDLLSQQRSTAVTAAGIRVSSASANVDEPVAVSVVMTPAVSADVSIIWSPFPDAGQGKRTTSYAWNTPGVKEIGVAVINPDGTILRADTTVTVVGGNEPNDNAIFLPLVVRESGTTAQAASPEIIGGREATPGAWPWQAALIYDPNNGRSQFCGGSLIDAGWVLTAAHCVQEWNAATTLYVLVGRHDLSSNDGTVAAVSRIVIHPDYNDGTSDSDVALLQLASPINGTTVSLTPVSFATSDAATVVGWGTTVEGVSSSSPDRLRQVEVPIVSTEACQASYRGGITATMLCAGRGGADSCQGDSGGPLMIPSRAPNGWTQIGVVSWGIGCGRNEFPGVYARLSLFVDWIAQQMGQSTATPDAFEPDNSRNVATDIAVDASQSHNLHVAGDEDWLRISAQANASYVIETSNLGANADTQLALFDASGTLLAEDDDGGAGAASRLEFSSGSAATYFARVRHSRGTGGTATGYTVSLRQQPGSTADPFEPDNDGPSARTIATDGTAQTHNFHVARDADWVRFAAAEGVSYVIETGNLAADADTIIELYDAQLSQRAVDDDGGEGLASRIEFTADATATFYVHVRHYSASAFGPSTQYDISVLADTPTGTTPDAYEPDNEPASAGEIDTDGTAQSHTFHVAGDRDVVRFTAVAGARYVVATTNLGADSDTLITLYDQNQNQVAEDDDGNGGAASRIEFTAAAAQTYYVAVANYSAAAFGPAASYDVSVTVTDVPVPGDAYEPDNSASAATLIPASALAAGGVRSSHDFHVAGDEDWVRFTADAGATYIIETLNLGPDGDTILQLMDADGQQVDVNDDSDGGLASRIEYAATSTLVVYARVTHYDEAASGPDTRYDLQITRIAADTDQDAYEPDDSAATGSTIATDGTLQSHNFHQRGDADWLRFVATPNAQYVIETSNLADATDTIIALFDADGTRVAQSDDDGAGLASRIEFTAPAAQEYSVRVRGYDPEVFGPEVSYDVSVIETAPSYAVADPSFEDPSPGWEEYSFQEFSLIYAGDELPSGSAQDGDRAAWLGGADDEVSYVSQEVTVPPDAPYLRYYHWIASDDLCGYDFGGVGVNGYWHMSYDLCAGTDTGAWVEVSADMREYAGQTIYLELVATTDSDELSSLLVDNVSFASTPVGAVASEAGEHVAVSGVGKAPTSPDGGSKAEPARHSLNGSRID